MIQINLIPEVKAKYIVAKRKKRLVILSSVTISGVFLGITILMASYVYIGQKLQLTSLDNSIKDSAAQLKKVDGLDKMLTIQNQLSALPALHSDKPVTSRLFTFLPQITPTDIKISSLDVNMDDSTIKFTGTAKSIESINKFVDTLKFTDYVTDQNQDKKRAFSTVVLDSFSSNDKESKYTISLKFDPLIFSSENKNVLLIVPKITSTRSQTEQPTELFTPPLTNEEQE